MAAISDDYANDGLVSVAELAGVVVTVAALSAWSIGLGGRWSTGVPLFFAGLCLSCLVTGALGLRALRLVGSDRVFPTTFLLGFFLVNSALYALAWLSPFGIVADFAALAVVVFLIALFTIPLRQWVRRSKPGDWIAIAAAVVGLCAATLWCQESLSPVRVSGRTVVFLPWVDDFFHTSQVRMIRDSRGFTTMANIRMAGRPARFYHFASYTVPALFSAATGTHTLFALTRFLVPFGTYLTGLAAFTLVNSWWGPKAGLGATAALVLMPDASGQGLDDLWLSYHWLQQIAPGGLYGVALLALTWLFMIRGCLSARLSLIGASYVLAALSVHYMAHRFVTNAVLLWLFPALFARGVRRSARIAWFVFALATVLAAAHAAERIPHAPSLRLDGSSMRVYVDRVLQNANKGILYRLFGDVSKTSSAFEETARGVGVLFIGTFGLLGVLALVLVLLRTAGPTPLAVRLFPVIMIVNYLVMSLGLAYDLRSRGHPEELQHRPLVWAYFAVSTWVGGAVVRGLSGRKLARLWGVLGVAMLFVLMLVPAYFGQEVQRGPEWGRGFTQAATPRGFIDCAEYIRSQSHPGDIVQCFGGDPKFIFIAWSERPAYAAAYFDETPDQELTNRLTEATRFARLKDEKAVLEFAKRNHIRWYVLPPGGRVEWPISLLVAPVFTSDGYRVYRFW